MLVEMAQSNVVNLKKKKDLCCVLVKMSFLLSMSADAVPEEVLLKGQGYVHNYLSFSMAMWDGTELTEQFHN